MSAGSLVLSSTPPAGWLAAYAGAAACLGAAVGALRGGPAGIAGMGLFFAVLGVIVVTDLTRRRIPNALTYPGTGVALAAALYAGTLADALGGLLLAGGVMLAFWIVGGGRLGLGDVKLSAFVGAALGLSSALTYLVLGAGIGAVTALAVLVVTRDRYATFPYGPPLVAGAAITATMMGLLVS